jgi:hypothetical protein
MAAHMRRAPDCWLDDLLRIVDQGLPVIVLMHYGPTIEPGVRSIQRAGSTESVTILIRQIYSKKTCSTFSNNVLVKRFIIVLSRSPVSKTPRMATSVLLWVTITAR